MSSVPTVKSVLTVRRKLSFAVDQIEVTDPETGQSRSVPPAHVQPGYGAWSTHSSVQWTPRARRQRVLPPGLGQQSIL